MKVCPQKILGTISDCGGHLDRFSPHRGALALDSSPSRSASPRHRVRLPHFFKDRP
jgi:hypothetical protein